MGVGKLIETNDRFSKNSNWLSKYRLHNRQFITKKRPKIELTKIPANLARKLIISSRRKKYQPKSLSGSAYFIHVSMEEGYDINIFIHSFPEHHNLL